MTLECKHVWEHISEYLDRRLDPAAYGHRETPGDCESAPRFWIPPEYSDSDATAL